jgi:hypothetical protein
MVNNFSLSAAAGKRVVNNPRPRLIDFHACGNMAVVARAEQKIAAGFRPWNAGR